MKKNLFFTILLLTGKLLLLQAQVVPSFNPPVTFSNGSSSGPGTVSDIDGDSKPDLVVFEKYSSVSILRNTSTAGNVSFAPTVNIPCGFLALYTTVADMDGDGKPDLLVAGSIPYDYLYSFVTIYRNTSSIGNISFAPGYEFLFSGTDQPTIATGDLDGDGRLDIAAQTPGYVRILRNTGSTGTISFELGPQFYSGLSTRSIAIADIDGDGKQDIATANYGEANVSVLRNLSNGTISFAPRVTFETDDRPSTVIAGDINGDNKPDLILNAHYEDSLTVLRNLSFSNWISFTKSSFKTPGFTANNVLSMGDFNGDGKPDIALANAGSLGGASTFNLSVYVNSSQGNNTHFSPAIPFYSGGVAMSMIGISDLDGDGKPDMAAGSENANLSLVFRNTTIISTTRKYVNDNSLAGDIFTTAVGNNSNSGSQSSPFATITHALSQSSEGDTIYADAGTYTEQLTITKGITIIGAGRTLTTVTNNPAITLVASPGTFTEIGLIQTAQNIGDVHISNMTVSPAVGSTPYFPHPIAIQSGGSVRGCTVSGGAVFFRIQNATKTALIENNNITSEYIGINCEGSGLSATLLNNTITVTNPGFSAAVFAGIDGDGFSPLAQLTAIGNFMNSYVTTGIQINSTSANITQNSFLGTGLAIQQNGSSNLLNGTCNWYGTTNSTTITSKISGNITHNPWLTNGTDNSSDPGFQPVAGSCSGRSIYYVNDNSRTGDLFTTAIGSNSNNGSLSAPFATLSHAITQAAADDYIYVDAGGYAEQVIIDKGITIIGAGQNLTSFTPPATPLVPAPGPFTEIGLFATSQNIGDVTISHLSINSNNASQNIIIQSGGVVRNCKLLNGGQGVFFRVDPATNPTAKTAVIEYNQIEPGFIGINCQGSNLTAFVINNDITKTSPYYAGIFAGLDFGPLPTLYIFNNILNNYNGVGLEANSNTGFYMNNSFTGTNGAPAIRRSSGNTPNATCNWFGSADQNIVIPQIQGAVTYSSWLISGTDNSVATGFQPIGACTGRQNKFYVNDNDITGDVFTTAIGNDNTGGVPSAPLATISTAYNRAQAGDTIFVDAGIYTAIDGTIAKSITILGTNYLNSPNSTTDPLLINSTRNAETNIENTTWTIGANEINLEGLTFNPTNKSALVLNNTAFQNIRLFKNRFKINAVNTVVNFTGVGTINTTLAEIENSGIHIHENRFEKNDATSGITINISRFRNIGLVSNSFVVTGSTLRTQSALSIGGGGLTDGIYLGNNHIENFSSAVIGNRFGALFINDNKIRNTSNALNVLNASTESSSTHFINNLLDGSAGVVPFIQYNRQGGSVAGSSSSLTIENNIINGTAVAGTTTLLGSMNLIFFNTVLNPSLVVRGNTINYSGDLSTVQGQYIRPIMLRGHLANVTIDKNEITLNGTNLQPRNPAIDLPVCPAITLYTDNGTISSIPTGAVINVLNNKINGFKHSFTAFDPGVGSTPYVGFGNIPNDVSVNINNNSFTGDSISINNGTVSQQVQANCNWYGSAALQDIRNKISLQTVAYTPYLINGTDNEPATTGFQPVAGSCNNLPVTATVDSYTNVTCNGANNGAINITVSGGVAPYTFAWTKDGNPLFTSAAEDPTNFGPGIYHLSITDALGTNLIMDANGNIITIDITITEPTVLTTVGSGTNVSCFNGSNGAASVLANGGTAPYAYLWSNGAITSSISNLTAGTYTVTVTDANGCTANSNYIVTQPTALTVSLTGTSATCNGSANATVAGGTSSYTYLWNNGATTQSISNVPAGIYSVVVTDANGCTVSGSFTINGSSSINPATTLVAVNCFGGSNGSITITGTNNGTAPFTYNLNGSVFQAGNVFSNLSAGVYVVGIKDATGCSDFVSRTIMQPTAPLTVVLDSTIIPCSGANNGRIFITANGGNAGRTYNWTGPNGYTSTSRNPNNIAAGQYNVTVTDSKGCTASLSVTLTAWPAINISEVVTNVGCRGEFTGAINVTVSGGTGNGFTFSWAGSGTIPPTEDINGLKSGNYTLSVTDAGSGCTVQKTITITQPATSVNVTAPNPSNIITCGGSTTLTATGTGGTAPYEYSLDGGPYQVGNTFTISTAGVHTVTVRDANGCTKTISKTVTDSGSDPYETNNSKNQSKQIGLATTINARIGTASDAADWFKFTTNGAGIYTLNLTHLSINYTFNVYTGVNNSPALIPLSTTATTKEYILNSNTTYHIQVTGTISSICYSLLISEGSLIVINRGIDETNKEIPGAPSIDVLQAKVYPNPHQGAFNLQISSPEDAKAIIQIITADGKIIISKDVMLQKGNSNIIYFEGIRQSVLLYRVIVNNKAVTGKIIGPN